MKGVCSGCVPRCIGVYQCGPWNIVQVCLCGDWRFVLTHTSYYLILYSAENHMLQHNI